MTERRSGKPLAAIASQGIVAASSLLLQIIAFRELDPGEPGKFALLFGILVTFNSVQSGWLGDSLTVLDRFDPGIRRALVRSQVAIVLLAFVTTTLLALPIGGIGTSTAVLFGLASTAWVIEETLRRLLIARREFTKLIVNDAAFAAGSFGLVGFVFVNGGSFTLETLVLALLAGAVVAVGVGVIQLPPHELSRGLRGSSRMRDVASFGVWRAAQVGLRPGSQTIVRAVVTIAVSAVALDQLEAARVLLAPVLTVVNGAGVYLLPTYSSQAKQGKRFKPGIPVAMLAIGCAAVTYGIIAIVFRGPLTQLLTDGRTEVTPLALLAWIAYAIGFGAGVPVGNALVARGRSRLAFNVRFVDAALGIAVASAFAVAGSVDAVPFGLAVGTFVGAALLFLRLRSLAPPDAVLPPPNASMRAADLPEPEDVAPTHDELRLSTPPDWAFQPDATPLPRPRGEPPKRLERVVPVLTLGGGRRRFDGDFLLWLVPLVAIVATEYKFRRREINEALGGSIDLMILVELAIYGLIGAWVVLRLAPTKPRLTPLLVAMWGYVLTTAASALYSAFPMLALARGVQLVIIAAAVHALATDGRIAHITKLVHAWLALITVSIGAGLVFVAPTSTSQVGRFTWLYVHSVTAGSMLALSVPMLLGLWLSAGHRENPVALPWPRFVYGALLVVHVVFLLATRTRGSIGGCFVALAVMAWVWSGQRAKPQLVLGGLVAGGASLLAFSGPLITFLTRGESAEKIGTFNRRTEIWSLAWDEFLSHPLHGLGFTSARGVFFDETELGGAHNALINVMIDTGLAGLGWWIALLVAVGVAISRMGQAARRGELTKGATGSARADRLILLGMFVSSLVNGITTEGLGAGVNVLAIWLYLMVAWICIMQRSGSAPEPSGELRATVAPSAIASPQQPIGRLSASDQPI